MTFTEAKNYLQDRFNYQTEIHSVMADGSFVQSDLVEFDFQTMIFVAEELSYHYNMGLNYLTSTTTSLRNWTWGFGRRGMFLDKLKQLTNE